MNKVTVVYGTANDECSLNNKAFEDFNEAWEYLQKVEKETGCDMCMTTVEVVKKTGKVKGKL